MKYIEETKISITSENEVEKVLKWIDFCVKDYHERNNSSK